MSLHSDSIRFVRSTYSEKKLAIKKALAFSQQEKEDIYVWEQLIDAQQHEYTLRKRADIIDLHSDHIVHKQRFEQGSEIRYKNIHGLRTIVPE